jgi:serine/threonine protein kinase
MRESWFLRQLQHPNIARLLHQYVSPNSVPSEVDPRDPTIYFIQDDCGMTLQTFLRNRYIDSTRDNLRVVPVHVVAAILRDLLSALVYLQRRGVLHRDIKADNVLVCGPDDGRNFDGLTAKLIDFGLAKKYSSGHSNVPAFGPSAVYGEGAEGEEWEVAAARIVVDAKAKPTSPSNVQSKLFGRPKQYAPEALGQQHLGLARQYTHDSDLWAVGTLARLISGANAQDVTWFIGTMILWPLLYLTCEDNLRQDFDEDGDHNYGGRMFPFEAVWGSKRASAYDRSKCLSVIKLSLQDKFSPASPDLQLFERMCHICSFMCSHDPKDRKMRPEAMQSAAEQCLSFLLTGTDKTQLPLTPIIAGPIAGPTTDTTFDPVCKFIDTFCASGHFRGSAEVVRDDAGYRQLKFKFHLEHSTSRTVTYRKSPDQDWLFVNENPGPVSDFFSGSLTYDDCLTPDYFVLPQELVPGTARPRAIFLPRNKFCYGMDESRGGMLNPARLTLLTQRDWFTVFRYERPGQQPWIIKWAVRAIHRF